MRNEHQGYNSLGYASEWHMTDVSIQKGIYFLWLYYCTTFLGGTPCNTISTSTAAVDPQH